MWVKGRLFLFRRIGATRRCSPDRFGDANAKDQHRNQSQRDGRRGVHRVAPVQSGSSMAETDRIRLVNGFPNLGGVDLATPWSFVAHESTAIVCSSRGFNG